MLRDAIGREWQCGTVQVDLNLPGRLGVTYVGEDGNRHIPVLIHRAIFGSLERFIAILLEHYAGNLPFWLSPQQIVIATITADGDEYAREVLEKMRAANLRVEVDLRNEKINYKVREHSLAKAPVIIAVGNREVEKRTVSIRRLGQKEQTVMPLDEAIAIFSAEAESPARTTSYAAA